MQNINATNCPNLRGPFDIIGDIHGCCDELLDLLDLIEFECNSDQNPNTQGRTLAFLGDLIDGGPKSSEVLQIVMSLCQNSQALCLPGNHDVMLCRALSGEEVALRPPLKDTIEGIRALGKAFENRVASFLSSLPGHKVLDGGRLVLTHAGLVEEMLGDIAPSAYEYSVFGPTTGRDDTFGKPERYQWYSQYHGAAKVVYGHTPVGEPTWINNTIDIDTGCVYGGSLTCLRYPELELLSVPSKRKYAVPRRPFL